ncbi:MAG: MFS transporter [Rhodospirillales bacterium]|nr:MFS transporter [Rhodospirillales bacterium]
MNEAVRRELPWWEILWRYSLFEAADSSWSLIVVSTYFGAFVQIVLGLPATAFGWSVTAASIVIALASPVLGAAADESGRRLPYLRISVAGVVLLTGLIGLAGSAWAALPCFMLAYIFANAAFTFFTAMIPAVSSERSVSRVVTMTIGVGYIGSLICLTLFGWLVPQSPNVGKVFPLMAVAYAAFALPVLLGSPDFPARAGYRLNLRAPYRRVRETFAAARRHRHLFFFLIGDFLYENAVASVITLMGLYSRNVMGFPTSELRAIFGPAIIVAVLSAWFLYSPLIKAIGPKRAVLFVLCIWLLVFAATDAIGPQTVLRLDSLVLTGRMLFVVLVAPLAGVGLAGVWSSSQVLLTALTPVEKSGEFWGLYNLSGRTASVLGDATWSGLLTLFGEGSAGYRIAVAGLALYVLLGAGFILSLPDVRPSRANFLGSPAS